MQEVFQILPKFNEIHGKEMCKLPETVFNRHTLWCPPSVCGMVLGPHLTELHASKHKIEDSPTRIGAAASTATRS